MVEEHLNSNNSPYKFNAKQLDEETGWYYYGARYYNPKWSFFISVDPLAEKAPDWTPYRYGFNNPVRYTDPTGMFEEESPIYDQNGIYLGVTSEGFSGQLLIMTESQFNTLGGDGMDHDLAIRNGTSFENANLTEQAALNIFNDIIKYANGMEIDNIDFDRSSIREGIITQGTGDNNWSTAISSRDGSFSIRRGKKNLPYEVTVENVTMSVVAHEWFSHAIMGTSNANNNHYEAYLSVMTHPMFSRTTDAYKGFNAHQLRAYYNRQVGRFDKLHPKSIIMSTFNQYSKYIESFNKFYKK